MKSDRGSTQGWPEGVMDLPIAHRMDEDACFAKLVPVFHPKGLKCPRCGGEDHRLHRHHWAPLLDHRCKTCGRVFNAFTGTPLEGTPIRPPQILLILRGLAQSVSTAQLARESGLERTGLLELRHRLQRYARRALDREPLPDAVAEADETYQNAGEKRRSASRPRRPAAEEGQ